MRNFSSLPSSPLPPLSLFLSLSLFRGENCFFFFVVKVFRFARNENESAVTLGGHAMRKIGAQTRTFVSREPRVVIRN